jgi:hypothetical protein
MRDSTFPKKLALMALACVAVLFAVFGLFPASFLGGVMGLNVAGILLGLPVTSGKLSTLLVAASMVMGVVVSGIIFITAASTAGWIISSVLDAVRGRKKILRQQDMNRSE